VNLLLLLQLSGLLYTMADPPNLLRATLPTHGSFGQTLAISPKGELLILDAANARVLRFRVNL